MTRTRAVVVALLLAFAVFCVVQDVVTVAGAKRYARLQREALAGRGPHVTVDEVMKPAVASSVRQGLVWGGVVAVVGIGVGFGIATRLKPKM